MRGCPAPPYFSTLISSHRAAETDGAAGPGALLSTGTCPVAGLLIFPCCARAGGGHATAARAAGKRDKLAPSDVASSRWGRRHGRPSALLGPQTKLAAAEPPPQHI